ncbi:MAG: hypothetical protein K6D59_09875, partial [Bacteroidales bacterium]|nr:hypothetical protein [Bacteroidales bacterium]
MKKVIIVVLFCYCNLCFSQSFYSVNIYISNPYVERVDVIKTQMYNMDYVRSHYATQIFSMEVNYVRSLFDSLQSFPLTKVAPDSISIIIPSYWGSGTLDMNFEPCIVIDFLCGNKYNTNEDVLTFSVDKHGY